MKTTGKWAWLEEYKHCSCSNVTNRKNEAVGYCAKHGNDRLRLIRLRLHEPIQLGHSTEPMP